MEEGACRKKRIEWKCAAGRSVIRMPKSVFPKGLISGKRDVQL